MTWEMIYAILLWCGDPNTKYECRKEALICAAKLDKSVKPIDFVTQCLAGK